MPGKNYVDPLLTNISKGWKVWGHVNQIILPVLSVRKPTAKIAVKDGSNLRIVSTIKAPEGETPSVAMNVSQEDSYTLQNHALKTMASDERAENQDKPFDELKDKAQFIMDLLSVSREYALSAWMNTVGNFTNAVTLSGTDQWGGSTDDPIGDLVLAVGTVADAMNVPDSEISVIMPQQVWRVFKQLPEVTGLPGIKNQMSVVIRAQQVADALGFKQMIIPTGRYNSAEDGQTDSFTNFWGDHCWAVFIPTRPSLDQHAFGYTPRRKAALITSRWRDEDIEGWWLKTKDEYDQYIMDETGAYMIKDAIA